MSALTPYALEHIELLKTLRTDDFIATPTSLAAQLGRDPSNVRKTVIRLRDDGFLSGMELTDQGYAALADYARMTGLSPAAGAAQLLVTHDQIAPDTLNPRKFTAEDEEGIADLAESIARDDLLENLVIRPGLEAGAYRLVAGERRWRAIAKLIEDGRWAATKPVPVKLIEIDDAAHRRIALVENLQRKDLRPMDEARALSDLIKVTGMSTAEVAAEIGFSQRYVQQRLQFLELPDDQAARLNRGELSIRDARQLVANKPEPIEDQVWLTALEILDRLRAEYKTYGKIFVQAEAGQDSSFTALAKTPFRLQGLFSEFDCGAATGRKQAFAPSTILVQVGLKYPRALTGLGDLEWAAVLADFQVQVTGSAPPRGVYTTPWLNGPFEIDPKIAAEIAEIKAERARQAAESQAREESEGAARAAAEQAAEDFLGGDRTRPLADILAQLGAPLPWSNGVNRDLVGASGYPVDLCDGGLLKLIAHQMNLAEAVAA